MMARRFSPPRMSISLASANDPVPAFLGGGGEMGERIRRFPWHEHPLGPPAQWPTALQMAVSLCLNSSFPTAIYWGQDMHLLYNDAWSVIPAEKHPGALGRTAAEVWPDIWHIIEGQLRHVLTTGEGLALYEQLLPMERGGKPRETWWNYSFTAIRHVDGAVGGVFNQGNDTTELVLGRRQRQVEIERWRELFRQAPAPVALLHGPAHVFEFANDAYLRLVGLRDVVGKPVREALPEIESQGFFAILDRVYSSGQPYVGTAANVKLQRSADAAPEDRILDFVCQPVLDNAGRVESIFVQATDVTDRARAEASLRTSAWQLGEERARLAVLVEAEQRAQRSLHLLNQNLEALVAARTTELSTAMAEQRAMIDRLRAMFETSFIFQGFMSPGGTLLDANAASLEVIRSRLDEVVGRPFWDTPWFHGTPGIAEEVHRAVQTAAGGQRVQQVIELDLPVGRRRFDLSLRPVLNARREVIGIVPEAIDITGR
ncbi:MAG: signal transduction protein: sensor, domain-like protein [Ramlibacter sp.]|jgi:PAS domain-containing protein|nr:signal transduction protein: sensor, domain-like protein [Ramlibacter sp.]